MNQKVSTNLDDLPIPTEMRIQQLAEAVRSGSYAVPAEKVAEAIILLLNPKALAQGPSGVVSPLLPPPSPPS
jgi:Anti-sigma-28 factor, FlgM